MSIGNGAILGSYRLLERIGNVIHHLGEVEAATMFKLISNLIGMTNLAVLAEGYVLARRAGIDPDAFAHALRDTGASSYQFEVRLPWIVAGDHWPRFAVDLALKDLRLAVDAAARWGVPTPVGVQGLSQLASASAHGFGDEDVTAMVKVLDPQQSPVTA
jgi:3-hydroxyisobutyrate dehydrogenase